MSLLLHRGQGYWPSAAVEHRLKRRRAAALSVRGKGALHPSRGTAPARSHAAPRQAGRLTWAGQLVGAALAAGCRPRRVARQLGGAGRGAAALAGSAPRAGTTHVGRRAWAIGRRAAPVASTGLRLLAWSPGLWAGRLAARVLCRSCSRRRRRACSLVWLSLLHAPSSLPLCLPHSGSQCAGELLAERPGMSAGPGGVPGLVSGPARPFRIPSKASLPCQRLAAVRPEATCAGGRCVVNRSPGRSAPGDANQLGPSWGYCATFLTSSAILSGAGLRATPSTHTKSLGGTALQMSLTVTLAGLMARGRRAPAHALAVSWGSAAPALRRGRRRRPPPWSSPPPAARRRQAPPPRAAPRCHPLSAP